MRLPPRLLAILNDLANRIVARRPFDFEIGPSEDPYIHRWWVIPRNRWLNIYLHRVMRDDDDRALHDHPWANCSILLSGSYIEHTIDAGGIHRRTLRTAGAVKLRGARAAHRLEIGPAGECWTFFLTGPNVRDWGFHCPEAGWRHWKDFTAGRGGALIGAGCGEIDRPPRRGRRYWPWQHQIKAPSE